MTTDHRTAGERGVVSVHGHAVWHRGVLTASIITAAFGIAWALWGASGLPAAAQGPVAAAGIVAGVIIIARAVRLRRTAPAPATSMFRSRQYRLVVAAEVVAIAAGLAALAVASEYIVAWVAIVVGVHFLAFGRFISAFYYPLGALVTAGGIAGIAVGVAGGKRRRRRGHRGPHRRRQLALRQRRAGLPRLRASRRSQGRRPPRTL